MNLNKAILLPLVWVFVDAWNEDTLVELRHDDSTEEFIVYDSRVEIKEIVMWKGYSWKKHVSPK